MTDDDTGLLLLEHRYYVPRLGRFLTQDPKGQAGGLNLYEYCGDNPVDHTDPTGLQEAEPDAEDALDPEPPPLGAESTPIGPSPEGEKIVFDLWRKTNPTDARALANEASEAAAKYRTEQAAEAQPGEHTVYHSVNDKGETDYVGRTNNFTRRQEEHLRKSGREIEPIDGLHGISKGDAMAAEQAAIERNGLAKNGGTLQNKINGIASNRAKYPGAIARGNALLKKVNYGGGN